MDKLPVLIGSKNYINEYEYTLKAANLLYLNKIDALKSRSLSIGGEYPRSKFLSLPVIQNIEELNKIPENDNVNFIIRFYFEDNIILELELYSENFDDIITVIINEIEVFILLKHMLHDNSICISDSDDIPYTMKDIDYFLTHIAGMSQGRLANTKEILLKRKKLLKTDEYNI